MLNARNNIKIYFAGAIRGGRENEVIYAQLIDFLGQFGEILTCHIGKKMSIPLKGSFQNKRFMLGILNGYQKPMSL